MPDAKLSKWYLDCVTDSGDVSIAYIGAFSWGSLRLSYSSLLESTGDQVSERRSLGGENEPAVCQNSITWTAKTLHTRAAWQSDSIAVRETILDVPEGLVEWHCLMPRAHALFRDRVGLGYCEHLTMTIAPWKLPIENLRWGRFISPSDWVVWIDWQGEFSRRIVYLNGESVPTPALEDSHIDFENGARLSMDRSLVLRDGPIGNTALSIIPGARRTFPSRILQVEECKWRSRAQLQLPTGEIVDGWAVHEKVRWPK